MNASRNPSQIIATIVAVMSILITVGARAQAEVPKPFSLYVTANKNYKGEVVVVLPPKEIQTYINKVKEGAKKDPEWFKEYSAKAKPGIPLPFHENLGLSPKEYENYRELWDKREFKVVQKVGLRFEPVGDKWRMMVTGAGARISLLRFDFKADVIKSTNGDLKRIEDIDAAPETILGAWKGAEWKFEEETGLGRTKRVCAIGKTADNKYGFVVYRLQDITSTNKVLFDQSMVIRFLQK